jgi:sugar/nucleoside kinase (ribokinase family)
MKKRKVMNRNRIVLAGNIIADNVKMIPVWPEKGMLAPIESMRRSVGGSVCNTGITLKTLVPSLEVAALGKVGMDDAGTFVLGELGRRGIDVSLVARTDAAPTTFTDCMTLTTTGERTFFNMHGADSLLSPEDVDPRSLDCAVFHLGYLLLLDGLDAADGDYGTKAARLLAKVQAAGVKTSIDIVSEQSDRFVRIVRPALRYCDYCVVNEIEASRATGVDKDDMRGLCEGMMSLGVRECSVVHRPEGSAALDRGGRFATIGSLALPDGWIVGSTGAGDAFCAGMLYSFLAGMSPEEGMRLASCAAACNLSVADSTSGARTLSETLDLEKRFNRRSICWST